ncbi:MAG: hypothetical protein GY703_01345 [Gammaproteobacteria bacterium]|nr:hypothetical protein [Gammaproteobacteria bacterium]
MGQYLGNFSYQSEEANGLTIKAEDGLNPGQVVLDGQQINRTLQFNAGDQTADLIIERVTIQNGNVSGSNTTGPRVTGHNPVDGLPGVLDQLDLCFSEPIKPETLILTGPEGANPFNP